MKIENMVNLLWNNMEYGEIAIFDKCGSRGIGSSTAIIKNIYNSSNDTILVAPSHFIGEHYIRVIRDVVDKDLYSLKRVNENLISFWKKFLSKNLGDIELSLSFIEKRVKIVSYADFENKLKGLNLDNTNICILDLNKKNLSYISNLLARAIIFNSVKVFIEIE